MDGHRDHELADCDHDPPPPVLSVKKSKLELERSEEQVDNWIARNRDYLTSPNFQGGCQLPSIARLWGYDEYYFRNEISRELLYVTRLAGRRLAPDEMAAFLHHTSRTVVAQSYDRPAAIVATLFLINRGWKDYTLPFYQPMFQRLRPSFFPSPTWPLARGRIAIALWQGLRCGLYGGLGHITYSFLAPRYRELFQSDVLAALGLEPHLDELQDDVLKSLERLDRD